MGNLTRVTFVMASLIWFFKVVPSSQGTLMVGALGNDTDQYLQYASVLSGIKVGLVDKTRVIADPLVVRTPGYPIILAIALFFEQWGLTFAQALIVVHAVLWMLAASSFVWALSGYVARLELVGLLLISSILMRPHLFKVMPEWSVFCFSVCAASFFIRYSRTRSGCSLALCIFSACLIALIRPDFIVYPVLLCALAIVISDRRKRDLAALTFGMTPVLLWLIFNLSRFDRLTMAPVEGHVYALVSLLGEEPAIPNDPQTASYRSFYTHKPQKLGKEYLFFELISLEPLRALDIGGANLSLADLARQRSGVSLLEANRAQLALASAYIREYPLSYAFAVLVGISTLIWATPAFVMLAICRRSTNRHFLLFAYIGALLHVVHVAFVSSVNIMHERYYMPTASLLLCGALLLIKDRLNTNAAPFYQPR